MEMDKLIIVSAPSGAGKTTLVKHLLSEVKELSFSISCTTRKARENEQHGTDYYFISKEDFQEKINQNAFVEWEEVYTDNFYGTLHSEIQRIWNEGKAVIFDIDVVGGVNLEKIYGDQALSLFIQAPSIEVLEKRLRSRGTETNEVIATRIKKAKAEHEYKSKFDLVITNDNLDRAKSQIVEEVSRFLAL